MKLIKYFVVIWNLKSYYYPDCHSHTGLHTSPCKTKETPPTNRFKIFPNTSVKQDLSVVKCPVLLCLPRNLASPSRLPMC